MFSVTALPASYGDCLWIEYGDRSAPRTVLVDAGPSVSGALENKLTELGARGGALELVVVTHIDADHIGGMIKLVEEDFYGATVKDFWFNGLKHLPSLGEEFGIRQANNLTKSIIKKKLNWNCAFNGGRIAVSGANSPCIALEGDARIRILSPDEAQLRLLWKDWIKVCGDADLLDDFIPSADLEDGDEAFGEGLPDIISLSDKKFVEDNAVANGSSIAFVFEYQEKKVLFCADAYPSRLLESLAFTGEAPYTFDLVKLPHHGSENNVSVNFVELIKSPIYLFSSSGAKFKHPSRSAVARVIRYGNAPTLAFNYRSEFSEIWDNPLLDEFPFELSFGDERGLFVPLLD